MNWPRKTTKTNRKVINGLYDELANALLTLLRHEALRIDASRAPNAAQGARAGQKKREDVLLGAPNTRIHVEHLHLRVTHYPASPQKVDTPESMGSMPKML